MLENESQHLTLGGPLCTKNDFFLFRSHVNEFERGILLIRHPLEAIMSQFNDLAVGKLRNTYATVEAFKRMKFSQQVFLHGLPKWQQFHDTVLKDFEHPLLVVEYEKLKSNSVSELTRILNFLGFEITSEIEHCLLENSAGYFKRKVRPKKELDEIHQTFSRSELIELQNIYGEYLKRFQAKLEESRFL